jgi:hypothetical protein
VNSSANAREPGIDAGNRDVKDHTRPEFKQRRIWLAHWSRRCHNDHAALFLLHPRRRVAARAQHVVTGFRQIDFCGCENPLILSIHPFKGVSCTFKVSVTSVKPCQCRDRYRGGQPSARSANHAQPACRRDPKNSSCGVTPSRRARRAGPDGTYQMTWSTSQSAARRAAGSAR